MLGFVPQPNLQLLFSFLGSAWERTFEAEPTIRGNHEGIAPTLRTGPGWCVELEAEPLYQRSQAEPGNEKKLAIDMHNTLTGLAYIGATTGGLPLLTAICRGSA